MPYPELGLLRKIKKEGTYKASIKDNNGRDHDKTCVLQRPPLKAYECVASTQEYLNEGSSQN